MNNSRQKPARFCLYLFGGLKLTPSAPSVLCVIIVQVVLSMAYMRATIDIQEIKTQEDDN